MKTRIALAIAALVAPGLAGCGTVTRTTVTTYQWMPPDFHGKTVYVYPIDPIKPLSHHAAAYAAMVGNELKARGFVILADVTKSPDFVAWMDFAVDGGHERSESWPVIGPDFYSPASAGGAARAFLPDNSSIVGIVTETHAVYGRFFTIVIIDRSASSSAHPKVVYEARAASEGRGNKLSDIVPVMIRAMFQDFPAASGSIRTFALPAAGQSGS
jgi:hypothetical protein